MATACRKRPRRLNKTSYLVRAELAKEPTVDRKEEKKEKKKIGEDRSKATDAIPWWHAPCGRGFRSIELSEETQVLQKQNGCRIEGGFRHVWLTRGMPQLKIDEKIGASNDHETR